MKTSFQQKAKIGQAGSLVNQLMANNSTIPVVGKGATELLYSDRHCYEVVEVSEDKKTVKLQSLTAKADPNTSNDVGHQNWILEPTLHFSTVVWRRNKWNFRFKIIRFTKEIKAKAEAAGSSSIAKILTEEQREAVYGGLPTPQEVVPGITEEAFVYEPVSIIFGTKDYYYDWSF